MKGALSLLCSDCHPYPHVVVDHSVHRQRGVEPPTSVDPTDCFHTPKEKKSRFFSGAARTRSSHFPTMRTSRAPVRWTQKSCASRSAPYIIARLTVARKADGQGCVGGCLKPRLPEFVLILFLSLLFLCTAVHRPTGTTGVFRPRVTSIHTHGRTISLTGPRAACVNGDSAANR